MKTLAIPLALLALTMSADAGVADTVAVIDRFTITRSGQPFFEDDFSAPTVPPDAPAFPDGKPAKYFVNGKIPPSSEVDGKLTLRAGDGELSTNATGEGRRSLVVRLMTNADPGDIHRGLKKQHTIEMSALFDFSTPTATYGGYGIQFDDFTGPRQATDVIGLYVFRDAKGKLVIRFLVQNFTDRTKRVIADTPVDFAGGDQILLILSRVDASTDVVTASYQFLRSGRPVTPTLPVEGTATLFDTVHWTRGGFIVFEQSQ